MPPSTIAPPSRWMDEAKRLNPGASDTSLVRLWERQASRRPQADDPGLPDLAPATPPSKPSPRWFAEVRRLNPAASEHAIQKLWEKTHPAKVTPPAPPDPASGLDDSDFWRGFKTTWLQLPMLAHGAGAFAAAGAESIFGEGGLATSIKQRAVRGMQDWGDDVEAIQKPEYSLTTALERAQHGNIGALADFMQYGVGYGLGQLIQLAGTAFAGGAAFRLLAERGAKHAVNRMVAREVRQIRARAPKGMPQNTLETPALIRQATRNVTRKLTNAGRLATLYGAATGMEAGEIGGEKAEQSVLEGRALTGDELALALSTSLAAGALEFVADKVGLDLLLSKRLTGRSLPGRMALGAAAQSATEAGTEYGQTLLEELGKGHDPFSAASLRHAFDAAGLGAVAGAAIGGVGAAAPRRDDERDRMAADAILQSDTMDDAIGAADEAVDGEGARAQADAAMEAEAIDDIDNLIAAAQSVDAATQPAATPERVQPGTVDEALWRRAHEAATSPLNDVDDPTVPQQEAGNYRKGHVRIAGLDVSIENPAGSVRRSKPGATPAWETEMRSHYGYIRRTVGADDEQIDVFVAPGTPLDADGPVFVINQGDPNTGRFDEHKAVLGVADEQAAIDEYLQNYDETGPQRVQGVARFENAAAFREWAQSAAARRPAPTAPAVPAITDDSSAVQVTPPAPPPRTPVPLTPIGAQARLQTPAGDTVGVRYGVVPLESLRHSGMEGYPAQLQPRDRTGAVSKAQVHDMIVNLNPPLMAENTASLSSGAPIVDPTGNVESGNARVMALREMRELHPDTWARYQEYVADTARAAGVELTGVDSPVLARVRSTPLSQQQLRRFVQDANDPTVLQRPAQEVAARDAAIIPGIVHLWRGGDVLSGGNREFLRAFQEKAVAQGELGSFMDREGVPSRSGLARVQTAMVRAAFDLPDAQVRSLFTRADETLDAVAGALIDVSGDWLSMRDAVRRGRAPEEADISPAVAGVIALIARSRDSGEPIRLLLRQSDWVSGQAVDVDTGEALLRLFYHPAGLAGALDTQQSPRPLGSRRTVKGLRAYVQRATARDASTVDAFGEGGAGTVAQWLAHAAAVATEGLKGAETRGLFDGETDDADPGRVGDATGRVARHADLPTQSAAGGVEAEDGVRGGRGGGHARGRGESAIPRMDVDDRPVGRRAEGEDSGAADHEAGRAERDDAAARGTGRGVRGPDASASNQTGRGAMGVRRGEGATGAVDASRPISRTQRAIRAINAEANAHGLTHGGRLAYVRFGDPQAAALGQVENDPRVRAEMQEIADVAALFPFGEIRVLEVAWRDAEIYRDRANRDTIEGVTVGGRSYLNLSQLQRASRGTAPAAVIGHEWLHSLQQSADPRERALHDEFVDRYWKYADRQVAHEAIRRRGYDAGDVHIEAPADFVGDALADPDFLRSLAADHATLLQRVLDSLRRFLDAVLTTLHAHAAPARYNTIKAVRDVEALREHVRALVRALLKHRAGGAAQFSSPWAAQFSRARKTPPLAGQGSFDFVAAETETTPTTETPQAARPPATETTAAETDTARTEEAARRVVRWQDLTRKTVEEDDQDEQERKVYEAAFAHENAIREKLFGHFPMGTLGHAFLRGIRRKVFSQPDHYARRRTRYDVSEEGYVRDYYARVERFLAPFAPLEYTAENLISLYRTLHESTPGAATVTFKPNPHDIRPLSRMVYDEAIAGTALISGSGMQFLGDRLTTREMPSHALRRDMHQIELLLQYPNENPTLHQRNIDRAIEHSEYLREVSQRKQRVEGKRQIPDYRHTGPDYRQGAAITPEYVQRRFGFPRPVTFGAYVSQTDRREWLGRTVDALATFAKLMGWPEVALGTQFHLALGALGRGGRHAAHYQQSSVLDNRERAGAAINLTRAFGDGSLAHELGHMWDYWLQGVGYASLRSEVIKALKEDPMTEERALEALRDSVREFGGLRRRFPVTYLREHVTAQDRVWADERGMDVLGVTNLRMAHQRGFLKTPRSASRLYRRALSESNDYWKRPTELFARVFEAFVADTLDHENTMLINKPFVAEGRAHYPSGQERTRMVGVMRHLRDIFEVSDDGSLRRTKPFKIEKNPTVTPRTFLELIDAFYPVRQADTKEETDAVTSVDRGDDAGQSRLDRKTADDMEGDRPGDKPGRRSVTATRIFGGDYGERPGLRTAGAHLPKPQYAGDRLPRAAPTFRVESLSADQRHTVELALESFWGRQRSGFMLGDGQGVGKTRQLLAIAAAFHGAGKQKILIVAPKQTIDGHAWQDASEASGFSHTKLKIINYEKMKMELGAKQPWDLVIYDEAHLLKNVESNRSQLAATANAHHVVYATGTPMDKIAAGVYFLAKVTGSTESDILRRIGVRIRETQKPGAPPGTMQRQAVLMEGFSHADVRTALITIRNEAIVDGVWVRREYPFYGDGLRVRIEPTAEVEKKVAEIASYWNSRIHNPRSGKRLTGITRRGLYRQEAERYLEGVKAPFIFEQVKRDLEDGKQAVVFFEGVNPKEVYGLGKPGDQRGGVDQQQEFAILEPFQEIFGRLLTEAGIPYAKVFGGAVDAAEGVAAFQRGDIKVLLATTKSGGVGLSLDDVTGAAPRAVHMATIEQAGDAYSQAVFRTSRRRTASPSVFRDYVFNNIEWERRREATVKRKLAILNAVSAGEEMDQTDMTEEADGGIRFSRPDRDFLTHLATVAHPLFSRPGSTEPLSPATVRFIRAFERIRSPEHTVYLPDSLKHDAGVIDAANAYLTNVQKAIEMMTAYDVNPLDMIRTIRQNDSNWAWITRALPFPVAEAERLRESYDRMLERYQYGDGNGQLDALMAMRDADAVEYAAHFVRMARQVTRSRREALIRNLRYVLSQEGYAPTERAILIKVSSQFHVRPTVTEFQAIEVKANNTAEVMPADGDVAAYFVEALRQAEPGASFKKLYRDAQQRKWKQDRVRLDRRKSGWRMFNAGNASPAKLSKACAGRNGWCVKSTEWARQYLNAGHNLHLYYERGEPEILFAEHDGQLVEVSGADAGQAFTHGREQELSDILTKRMDAEGMESEEWKRDKLLLTMVRTQNARGFAEAFGEPGYKDGRWIYDGFSYPRTRPRVGFGASVPYPTSFLARVDALAARARQVVVTDADSEALAQQAMSTGNEGVRHIKLVGPFHGEAMSFPHYTGVLEFTNLSGTLDLLEAPHALVGFRVHDATTDTESMHIRRLAASSAHVRSAKGWSSNQAPSPSVTVDRLSLSIGNTDQRDFSVQVKGAWYDDRYRRGPGKQSIRVRKIYFFNNDDGRGLAREIREAEADGMTRLEFNGDGLHVADWENAFVPSDKDFFLNQAVDEVDEEIFLKHLRTRPPRRRDWETAFVPSDKDFFLNEEIFWKHLHFGEAGTIQNMGSRIYAVRPYGQFIEHNLGAIQEGMEVKEYGDVRGVVEKVEWRDRATQSVKRVVVALWRDRLFGSFLRTHKGRLSTHPDSKEMVRATVTPHRRLLLDPTAAELTADELDEARTLLGVSEDQVRRRQQAMLQAATSGTGATVPTGYALSVLTDWPYIALQRPQFSRPSYHLADTLRMVQWATEDDRPILERIHQVNTDPAWHYLGIYPVLTDADVAWVMRRADGDTEQGYALAQRRARFRVRERHAQHEGYGVPIARTATAQASQDAPPGVERHELGHMWDYWLAQASQDAPPGVEQPPETHEPTRRHGWQLARSVDGALANTHALLRAVEAGWDVDRPILEAVLQVNRDPDYNSHGVYPVLTNADVRWAMRADTPGEATARAQRRALMRMRQRRTIFPVRFSIPPPSEAMRDGQYDMRRDPRLRRTQVSDVHGRPLRVFAGSPDGKAILRAGEFDPRKLGTRTGALSARKAFFFTDSELVAETYASPYYDLARSTSPLTATDKQRAESAESDVAWLEDEEALALTVDREGDDWVAAYQGPPSSFGDLGPKVTFVEATREAAMRAAREDIAEELRRLRALADRLNARFEDDFTRARDRAAVVPVYLSIQNPLVKTEDPRAREPTFSVNDAIEDALAGGHDGVIIEQSIDARADTAAMDDEEREDYRSTHYAVFSPSQIINATTGETMAPTAFSRPEESPDDEETRRYLALLTDDEFREVVGVLKDEFVGMGAVVRGTATEFPFWDARLKRLELPASETNQEQIRKWLRHELTHVRQWREGRLPTHLYDPTLSSVGSYMDYYGDPGEIEARVIEEGGTKDDAEALIRQLEDVKRDLAEMAKTRTMEMPRIKDVRVVKRTVWQPTEAGVQTALRAFENRRRKGEYAPTANAIKAFRQAIHEDRAITTTQSFGALIQRLKEQPGDASDVATSVTIELNTRRLYGEGAPGDMRAETQPYLSITMESEKTFNPIMVGNVLEETLGVHRVQAVSPTSLELPLDARNREVLRRLQGQRHSAFVRQLTDRANPIFSRPEWSLQATIKALAGIDPDAPLTEKRVTTDILERLESRRAKAQYGPQGEPARQASVAAVRRALRALRLDGKTTFTGRELLQAMEQSIVRLGTPEETPPEYHNVIGAFSGETTYDVVYPMEYEGMELDTAGHHGGRPYVRIEENASGKLAMTANIQAGVTQGRGLAIQYKDTDTPAEKADHEAVVPMMARRAFHVMLTQEMKRLKAKGVEWFGVADEPTMALAQWGAETLPKGYMTSARRAERLADYRHEHPAIDFVDVAVGDIVGNELVVNITPTELNVETVELNPPGRDGSRTVANALQIPDSPQLNVRPVGSDTLIDVIPDPDRTVRLTGDLIFAQPSAIRPVADMGDVAWTSKANDMTVARVDGESWVRSRRYPAYAYRRQGTRNEHSMALFTHGGVEFAKEIDSVHYGDDIREAEEGWERYQEEMMKNQGSAAVRRIYRETFPKLLAQIAKEEKRPGLKPMASGARNPVTGRTAPTVTGFSGLWVDVTAASDIPTAIMFSRPVLDPAQYTPEQRAALERVTGTDPTMGAKTRNAVKDWRIKLAQGMFDQFARIYDYSKHGYMLARLSKAASSETLEAVLRFGPVEIDKDGAYVVAKRRPGQARGFLEFLQNLGGEHDKFLQWVAAKRAGRLKGIGLERLYSQSDIATLSAMDTGTMADGRDRHAVYAQALEEFNDWNARIVKIAYHSGLTSKKSLEQFAGLPYVPFYRLYEEGVLEPHDSGGLVNQHAWKRLKGGTQKINQDLVYNLLSNWAHVLGASMKNRATRETMRAAAQMGAATKVSSKYPGKDTVRFRDNVRIPNPAAKDQGDAVPAQIEVNSEQVYVVDDPYLLDAVSSLHYAGLGPVGKPFEWTRRILTKGVTADPRYKLRNLIRDSIHSIAVADLSANPAHNVRRGWKATDPNNPAFQRLLVSGAVVRFGTMLEGDNTSNLRRLIANGVKDETVLDSEGKWARFRRKYISRPWRAYTEFGDRGEQVNRAALYQRLRRAGQDGEPGMSHMEASFWARDLMDFGLHGRWTAVRILKGTLPFMNTRLQGLYKLSGGTTKGVLLGRAGAAQVARLSAVLGATSLASIMLLLAYRDDDDWKQREEWDRDNYWWFKVAGTAFRIPKPFEVGALATVAERTLEYMIDETVTFGRFASRILALVEHQLAMNPMPQLVRPLIDVWANRDSFTGRPIESLPMRRLERWRRYTARTSRTARVLGQAGVVPDPMSLPQTGWQPLSPVQIDHLVKSYFAWLGIMGTVATDAILRPFTNEPPTPDKDWADAAGLHFLVEPLPGWGSGPLSRLYEQLREMERAYATWKLLTEAGEHATVTESVRLGAKAMGVRRQLSRLTTQIRLIERHATMSAAEKRRRITPLRQRLRETALDLEERGVFRE